MDNALITIFAISVLLILHTYLFYPLGMMLFFSKKKRLINEYTQGDVLPPVAILIAAYNEEKVIEEKLNSVFNTGYPLHQITVYVGSDASTDKTEEIVLRLGREFKNLHLITFPSRVGKIGIVNQLQSIAKDELLILTDANVVFNKSTIFELVKKFRDERTGIVAANIIKESISNEGISFQEKKYLSLENRIKACESNAFGMIMGAEGGCYALRNNLFTKVPAHFIVDDFYITLNVINAGKFALFNSDALCNEDVANDTAGEYRRKVRISSGNFQNLFHFKKNLVQFWTPVFFTFWSHKVLRWITPFLLFVCLFISAALLPHNKLYFLLFVLQLLGLLIPLFNYFFKFKNVSIKFISHFYLMNFALLQGFVKFSRGIKSSIWQPIKRNV
jgi:cellulose synthase/poly-beta-1,6-N-acetylglucosamine synthase-like glycosyltransferase